VARGRGAGCALAVFALFLGAVGIVGYKFVLPWWRKQPPPASGKELQVHVLDLGTQDGDAILIVAPEGKIVLIDAGEIGKGKAVLEALKRYDVQQIDYFIAADSQPDHIGGAADVLKAVKASVVLHNGFPPPDDTQPQTNTNSVKGKKPSPPVRPLRKPVELPTVKTYNEFKSAVEQSGADFKQAEPGQTYDLGAGARLTVLAPIQPFFTREQMKAGGNEPSANSIVVRLDYGDFSMLLPGDAEAQTEQRMTSKGAQLNANILKIAHHGSKYATSDEFLKRVKPEAAIISDGEYNRYGHPAQVVLDRLKAAGVKVYRTDLQGEITILTKGKTFEVKTAKEAKSDVWAGRDAQKDDSSRSGFISYGDFGPPPRPPKPKPTKK
jgi:competence protein ComEC